MTFQVLLTDDASRDLEELYDYIESHDAPGRAEYVLDSDVRLGFCNEIYGKKIVQRAEFS